jgi:hypothetical protein
LLLTKEEADSVIAAQKVISANVSWHQRPSGVGRRFTLEASVLEPSTNILLKLYGRVGKKNYSFSLLYGGDVIRKYTVHDRHHNPDCTWIEKPHKHLWDDINEDGYAYIPTDIDTSDIHKAFTDFLKECNITLTGTYSPFLV